MDPRNLWIDFEHAALYHRLKLEAPSPIFESAADLDTWIKEQNDRLSSKSKRAA